MVMATDGLWDVVTEDEIPSLFHTARVKGLKKAKILAKYDLRKKMRKLALEAGKAPPSVISPPQHVPEPDIDFARVLAKEALKRGSRDNISIVVVFASHQQEPLQT